jgi:hypothetical protein
MTDPMHPIVEQPPDKRFKKIGLWRLKIIGKPRKIPMKDGSPPTFQKDSPWRLKNIGQSYFDWMKRIYWQYSSMFVVPLS